jgi:hypothetical protein
MSDLWIMQWITDIVVITGGMISWLHTWVNNKSQKDHLRQLFFEWLLAGDCVLIPAWTEKKASV